MKQKIYYIQLLKTVKRLLNKLIQNDMKHLCSSLDNQGKSSYLNHQSQMKDRGW